MIALVTGGTGFIGSHVVDALLAAGYNVRCLVRNALNPLWLAEKPVELIQGTLEDHDALAHAMEGIDVVIHVAGLTAARSREEFFRGNVDATRNILEAATQAKNLKRFVHVSSQAAVGPGEKDQPVDETTPYHPITAYGESKRAAEELVLTYQNKFPITIVRPPAVYGPRDRGIYTFFQTINMGIMPLIGFQEKYVSLVHARDLAQGLLLAATSDAAIGEIFFISSEKFYSWREIGAITKQVMQKKAVPVYVPHSAVLVISSISQFLGRFQAKPPIFDREKGEDIVQGYWTCKIEKAKKLLHYRETINLADGIKETIEWYRANKWL